MSAFDAGKVVRSFRSPHYVIPFDPSNLHCNFQLHWRVASPTAKHGIRKRSKGDGILDIDPGKFGDLMADHCVVGWEGLNLKDLELLRLLPPAENAGLIEALAKAGQEELEWSTANGRLLIRESQPYRDRIDSLFTDVEKVHAALEVARGETTPGGVDIGTETGSSPPMRG